MRGRNGAQAVEEVLTPRAGGRTRRPIAEFLAKKYAVLQLSDHTVKTYVSKLFRRLRLSRRAEAAILVARRRSGRA